MKRGVDHALYCKKDEGYAWVVLVACMFLSALCAGQIIIYGALIPEVMETFRVSSLEAAVTGSLGTGLPCFTRLFLGPVLHKHGSRKVVLFGSLLITTGLFFSAFVAHMATLHLLLGVLPGIGVGCLNGGLQAALRHYFAQRRSLALGFQGFGACLGLFALPPTVKFLLQIYSWRGCVIWLSVVQLTGFIWGALLGPKNTHEEDVLFHQHKFHRLKFIDEIYAAIDVSMLKKPRVISYYISQTLLLSGHATPLLFLPALAMEKGVKTSDGVILLSLHGIIAGITGPFVGFILNRVGDKPALLIVSGVIGATLNVLSTLMETFPQLAVVEAVRGATSSVYLLYFGPVLEEVAEAKHYAAATGLFMFFNGMKNIIGHPFGGLLADIFGTYSAPFMCTGALQLIGGVTAFIMVKTETVGRWTRKMTSQNIHLM